MTASLPEAQFIESALLNIMNFQTLIATKAARVCIAAEGDPVVEFGLRRAHGPDAALGAARAAFIGGAQGTSNVLAGKLFGIPVRGTLAHSWVESFPSELEAFRTYCRLYPEASLLLVDTYDTLKSGVPNAIKVGKEMRSQGRGELRGIRLDSGDLAYLSQEARKMLDKEGFQQTKIFASSDLDEWIIESIKKQGGRIDTWGVGTKLVTAYSNPALGGVYKLTGIEEAGRMVPKIKRSDNPEKVTNPGMKKIIRFFDPERFHAGGRDVPGGGGAGIQGAPGLPPHHSPSQQNVSRSIFAFRNPGPDFQKRGLGLLQTLPAGNSEKHAPQFRTVGTGI